MRKRPEAIAWMVILSAFAVFCFLVSGLAAGGYWYWRNATDSRWARLTIIEGSVAVKEIDRPEPVVGRSDEIIHEGDSVITSASSRAFLTLFDSSTVTLYPDTELTLTSLCSRRFRGREIFITLRQSSGKTIVGVAPPSTSRTNFQVELPEGRLSLAEGSYTVDVNGRDSRIKVREVGAAVLTSGNESVQLGPKQVVEIASGRPGAPRPLGEELIANGDFRQELSGWQQGVNEMVPDVRGRVEMVADERPAARFVRLGTRGSWAETLLHQDIKRDVSDALSLRLSIDLKLLYQDVQGGGDRGSEYPMLVRIDYRTVGGWEAYWVRGFYYTNSSNNPTTNGVSVAQNEWVTYVEPLDLLSLDPKPREILSIRLIAGGHDYESMVRKVSLIAE